ncbi:hypothetical protein CALCODRAFT_493964 [Calocera cornea HHB12733]|uniref:Uncharacterized protein n=1 Tax=Calocera cornea HHB12733 TaxID=1353952 RepID=A0A165HDX6_9BASI|nr:hypothetical protein CALCODRAFT_493964 [Calocera cornea HHB12733]
MHHPLRALLLLLSFLPALLAQWVTVTQIDDDTGYTMLDSISYGPGGNPRATRVISTLYLDDVDAGAAAATTAPPRIVGQPGTATGVATIVFEYTSDGETFTATFTPTYQSPSPTLVPQVGTIISAPDWTFTQAAEVASSAPPVWGWPWGSWARMGAVVGVGMILGGWWVL